MKTKLATAIITSICLISLFTFFQTKATSSTIFSDDFETSNFKAWNLGTEGNITVQNTFVNSGNYAAISQFTGKYQSGFIREGSMTLNGNYAYVQMATRFTALPGNNQEFIPETWISSNFAEWLVVSIWNNQGTIELSLWNCSTKGNYRYANAPYPFQPNVWYTLKIEAFYNTTNGWVSAWINNAQIINQAPVNTASITFWGIHVGCESYSMTQPFNMYSDDVICSTTDHNAAIPVPNPTPTPAPVDPTNMTQQQWQNFWMWLETQQNNTYWPDYLENMRSLWLNQTG